jgi:hypothetical protein
MSIQVYFKDNMELLHVWFLIFWFEHVHAGQQDLDLLLTIAVVHHCSGCLWHASYGH